MITFKYIDEQYGTDAVSLEVTTTHAHIDGVVEAFKTFLTYMAHHPDNVARVTLVGPEERQGLPTQLELFPDDYADDGTPL